MRCAQHPLTPKNYTTMRRSRRHLIGDLRPAGTCRSPGDGRWLGWCRTLADAVKKKNARLEKAGKSGPPRPCLTVKLNTIAGKEWLAFIEVHDPKRFSAIKDKTEILVPSRWPPTIAAKPPFKPLTKKTKCAPEERAVA